LAIKYTPLKTKNYTLLLYLLKQGRLNASFDKAHKVILDCVPRGRMSMEHRKTKYEHFYRTYRTYRIFIQFLATPTDITNFVAFKMRTHV